MEQNDVIKRLIADNKDDMTYVTDSDGIVQAMSEGKIASLIGVESGHAINSNMGSWLAGKWRQWFFQT